jgi:S1-C subfamily serine protease
VASGDPLRAVGSVFARRGDPTGFRGTCFAFRTAGHLLTAGHCVEGLHPEDVEIAFLGSPSLHAAAEVARHPTADLAIVRLAARREPVGVEPFAALAPIARRQRFAGFGSVAGDFRTVATLGDGRIAGRLRRAFTDPEDGHRHAEMSVAARDGFSGGPLFLPAPPHAVIGLMAANRRHPLALGSARTEGRGIALLLDELSDWIDEHAPR